MFSSYNCQESGKFISNWSLYNCNLVKKVMWFFAGTYMGPYELNIETSVYQRLTRVGRRFGFTSAGTPSLLAALANEL